MLGVKCVTLFVIFNPLILNKIFVYKEKDIVKNSFKRVVILYRIEKRHVSRDSTL